MLSYSNPAWRLVTVVCFFVSLQVCERLQVRADDFRAEVQRWRAEHEASFRSPSGWLALTGHYWLKPGDNPVGSTDNCVVKLPADAAKEIVGSFRLVDNKVSLTITSGGPILVDGSETRMADLPIDNTVPESDSPTKMEIGERLKLQLVRRAGRLAVRVRDSQSELLKAFRGKRWFDIQEQYRVTARYEKFDRPKLLKITNIKGDEVDSPMSGTLVFELQGQVLRLDAVEESPGSLFVTFRDQTSGKSTYGAGRFIDVKLPTDKEEPIVIDFNKAYSPPCAWSPHTLCPLPPKQNHLPLAIESGERL